MDERLNKYFEITEENAFVVKENVYVETHIPKEDVEDRTVEIIGDTASLFGQLDFYVWEQTYSDDLKIDQAKKVLMRLPNLILTKPGRIRYNQDLAMYIFEYNRGDKIIVNTRIEQSVATVVKMFKRVIHHKIPDDVPYDQIPYLIEECARINGYNLRANILFIDLISMVVARDPHNPVRQFREYLNSKKGVSMLERKLIDIDNIPALVSQFGALSSGSAKRGMTATIGAIRSGEMDVEELDVEKVL